MYKIFIDGQAGTTGLEIHQRLQDRSDIELLSIAEADRKDPLAKHDLIRQAEVAILCLPDAAARQTVNLAADTNTRILDASTAFRTQDNWAYGLAELDEDQRAKIYNTQYVSNPGCYPTGFLLAVTPLINTGLLKKNSQLTISAVSGYSGGGRQLIEKYQAQQSDVTAGITKDEWNSRPYSLSFGHKHVPEMQKYASLDQAPLFLPSVGAYLQGMLVSIPLAKQYFNSELDLDNIHQCLQNYYENEPCIHVHQPNDQQNLVDGFLSPEQNNGTNRCDIYIFGNNEQLMLIAQLDNLGKGAAGAAVQNLNIMLGVNELNGLTSERTSTIVRQQ